MTGAPHPSTAVAATGSSARSAMVSAMSRCSGWSFVAVGAQVPAVEPAGGEHGRVLARAVLGERPGRAARGDPHVALVGVVGQVGGVLEVGLGETDRGEHVADRVEVEGLCGVARAGEREVVGRQHEAGTQHGHRLERLVRRAREDRVVRGPPHVGEGAVGPGDGDAPAVHRLHHAAPRHVGDHGCVGEGGRRGSGRLGHAATLSAASRRRGCRRAPSRRRRRGGDAPASVVGVVLTSGGKTERPGPASRPRSSGVSPGKGGR